MSHITEPRVAESSVTTGVGAFTLAGALTAHVAFSGVCAVGDTVWYDIEAIGADGLPSGAWEEGLGTYSAANTLTRTTVYRSTNANAAVNFAAGTKYVRLIADARQIAKLQNLSGVNTGDQDLSGYATTASLSAHTSSTANPHGVTATQVGAPSGSGTSSGTNTGDETATSVGALISGATVKATPVDADALGLSDSAAANVLKKLTWANLKATLKTYFDTLYQAAGNYLTSGGALGTPSSGTLTNCTFPTLNQNTSGTAAGLSAVLSGASGGTGVANTDKTITLGGNFTTSGAYAFTGTLTGTTGVTFPVTGTLGTLAGTETLTNKRVTPRVGSTTSSATPTINTDNVDIYKLTAQAEAVTSFTTNLSGTPSDGDGLIIQVTGTAARGLTWGTSFEASTVALPTTTVSTAMLTVGFIYNGVTSKWRCVGSC